MTNSGNPSKGPRFVGGAIDLGELKKTPQNSPQSSVEVERFAEVTPQTFEQDLVIRSTEVPVVLLLGTGRSEASEQLKTSLARLAQTQEQIQWVARYVDVDTNGEIAQALQVQAVPTVIALAAGRPLTQFEGAQPEEQIQQWIAAVLQATEGKLKGLGESEPPLDPRFEQAAEALEAEDYDSAIATYDALLAEGHADAKPARANAVLMQRMAKGEADEADRLVIAGQKAQAFDQLIERIRGGETEAKDRLLELLAMFDHADPEVIEARTKMASALF